MKKYYFLIFISLCFTFGYGQSIERIISFHIKAIGGQLAIDSMKSLVYEETIHAMGTDAPSTVTILSGKAVRLESDIHGEKMIHVFTDKSGWSVNPMSSNIQQVPMGDEEYQSGKYQIEIGGPLFYYKMKENKIRLITRNDTAYILQIKPLRGSILTLYIDLKTFLIIKLIEPGSVMGQKVDILRTFENYRKAENGFVYPAKEIDYYGDQFSIVTIVKSIQINPLVDENIFLKP
jgi:hypothetical protein